MLLLLAAVFLIAGTVKGVVGMGMPTIALASLAIFKDVTFAMAMIIVPTFATNLVQAFTGPNLGNILSKIWLFLVCVAAFTWVGLKLSFLINPALLSVFLGVILIGVAALGLVNHVVNIRNPSRRITTMGIGTINGLVTGMTGTFIFPSVMYLQAHGFKKDVLVQAMGITFSVLTLALGLGLRRHELLSNDLLLLSGMAILPAVAGMKTGQGIRGFLKEKTFKRVFNLALILLGFAILFKAVWQIL